MTSLITRLGELKGPDRDVDFAIWEYVDKPAHDAAISEQVQFAAPNKTYIHDKRLLYCPHYTASIDAALTLVPEGYFWWLGHLDETDRRFVATVSKRAVVDYPAERAICDTAAIALCIAALQARGVK